MGAKHAEHVQFYQSMGLVVSQAFGGKTGSSSTGEASTVPQTRDEMISAFAGVFG